MSFIKIAKQTDLTEGKVLAVNTKFGRIALLRRADKIHAFQDICTHDDGPLGDGPLDGCIITCPRHGAQFNIETGAVLKMPATEDIEVYPARLNGEDVEVDLE